MTDTSGVCLWSPDTRVRAAGASRQTWVCSPGMTTSKGLNFSKLILLLYKTGKIKTDSIGQKCHNVLLYKVSSRKAWCQQASINEYLFLSFLRQFKNVLGFPGGASGKESSCKWNRCKWQMRVRSLGQEDLLEESMATHSSVLAWEMPWTEEPGKLPSIGLQRVGHDWSDLSCTHVMLLDREENVTVLWWCKTTSVFLGNSCWCSYGWRGTVTPLVQEKHAYRSLDGWMDRWMEGQMIQRDREAQRKHDKVNQPKCKNVVNLSKRYIGVLILFLQLFRKSKLN